MKNKQTRNWSSYNQKLQQIARIDFFISSSGLNDWHYTGKRKPGGKVIYNDYVIELCLLMKEFYKLPYRQTSGFVSSILSLSGFNNLSTPDYTTLSRRSEDIDINIRKHKYSLSKFSNEPIIVAIDSTGLSLYNYSDWHNLKHREKANKSRTERWKKLHVAIDVSDGEILSAIPSHSVAHDCKYMKPLLDDIDINSNIGSVCADMAYDTRDCREIIKQYKAKQLIPPRRQAVEYKKGHYKKNKINAEIFKERDDAIRYINRNIKDNDLSAARSLWKEKVGYHKRSLVETTMYQIKAHTTDKLTNKKELTRNTQSMIKCKIVNMINAI